MERHVLVVFPHPDDESFAAGGTIRQYRNNGVPVTYACGTLGQMGRNMGKNVFANRETIPSIRKRELEEACQAMGIEDLRLLGFHDKTLEFEDVDYVADKIEEVIQDVNPSLIITFYPEHGVHPDHNAFGRAAVRAVERMPKEERPVIHAVAITKARCSQRYMRCITAKISGASCASFANRSDVRRNGSKAEKARTSDDKTVANGAILDV